MAKNIESTCKKEAAMERQATRERRANEEHLAVQKAATIDLAFELNTFITLMGLRPKI